MTRLDKQTKIYGAIGVIALGLIALFASFSAAKGTMEGYGAQFQDSSRKWTDQRSEIFASPGLPKTSINLASLQRYLTFSENEVSRLRGAIQRIRNGEGLQWWFPKRREALTREIESRINQELQDLEAAKAASRSVELLEAEVIKATHFSSSTLEEAEKALQPKSDVEDFARHERALALSVKKISATRESIVHEVESTASSEDLDGRFRHGLLQGMIPRLEASADAVRPGISTQAKAGETLGRYKSTMHHTISNRAGLVRSVHQWSSDIQPPVRWTRERCGEAQGLIEDFRIVIAVLEKAQPKARLFRYGLQGACVAVDWTGKQIDEIIGQLRPVVNAMRKFELYDSRDHQLEIVAAAPPAAKFFADKEGLFNPVIEKIESLQAGADSVLSDWSSYEWVRNLRTKVNGIADQAQMAIFSGNMAITHTATALRSFEAREDTYRTNLAALAGAGT